MGQKTIVITDPQDALHEYVYDRERRSGFYYTTIIPGGDDLLGFNPPCSDISGVGFPLEGSKVEVFDEDVDYPIWIGRLEKPSFVIEDRVLTSVSLEARGYWHSAEDQEFLTKVTFGPVTTGSSPLTDKVNITDIGDAMTYALSQLCPDITIDPAQIADSGINIVADSQGFAGQHADQVFNFFAALTAYLSTPMVWQVYPDPDTSLPTFRFWTVDTNPSLWDDGKSKQQIDYDLARIINRATVEWGTQQKWTEPTDSGGSIDYTAVGGFGPLRDKYTTYQMEYQGLDDIKALARGYLAAFNVKRAAGNIVLTEAPRTYYFERADIGMIRAGQIIECELPDDFPYDDVDRYIVATRWQEGDSGAGGSSGSCDSVTLTVGEITGIYSEIRRLASLPNNNILWSIDFATYGRPLPEVDKTQILGPQWPTAPVPGTSPAVNTVIPVAAMSNGTDTFGPHGGQLHPDILPNRYMGPMMVFSSGDGSPLAPTADAARGSCLDWKNLNKYQVLSRETATAQLKVYVGGVLKVTCILTTAKDSGMVAIGTPFSTTAGDVISYDIVSNDLSTQLTIMVFGEADHPTFPVYPAPVP